jgi:hypothetical protein
MKSMPEYKIKSGFVTFDDPPKEEPPGDDNNEPKLPQSKVNSLIANEKRKYEEKTNALMQQVDDLKNLANLKEEDRSKFENKVEELKNENLTTQQQYEKKLKKLESERDSLKTELESKANFWSERYKNERIDNSILSIISSGEKRAYKPEQVLKLLKPDTSLKAVLDDQGNETGDFEVMVKMDGPEGNKVELKVQDAINMMIENTEEYGNLFVNSLKRGVDRFSSPNANQGGNDIVLGKTSEEYRKSREKNLKKVGARR